MTNNFETYLKQSSREIEKELNTFSQIWNDYIHNNYSDLKKINKRFMESLYGGKMLRGTLVKFGYELFQIKPTEEILKSAAAFEIIHSSLLIHDDILDQSPLRRGKPAMYVSQNSHYGLSQAICLGDLGLSMSFRLMLDNNFPAEVKNAIVNFFSTVVSETILGQMLDVEYSQIYERTEEQIMNIYLKKTAHYTVVGPLTVGAIFAGATDEMLEKVKQFGEHLGIAFQIQDDILGIFGDDQTTGKSTTSDIQENKSTLLFTYALKHANPQQEKILKTYYGKKTITKSQHEQIKNIFIQTGSLEYSQEKITMLISKAKAIVPHLSRDKHKQILLTQLADMLVSRKK